METHPALGDDKGESLSTVVGRRVAPPEVTAKTAVPGGLAQLPRRVAKGLIRRGIAWYVDPKAEWHGWRAAEDATAGVMSRLEALERRLGAWDDRDPAELVVELELLKAELRSLRGRLGEGGAGR